MISTGHFTGQAVGIFVAQNLLFVCQQLVVPTGSVPVEMVNHMGHIGTHSPDKVNVPLHTLGIV
jgi:hypothetical protein